MRRWSQHVGWIVIGLFLAFLALWGLHGWRARVIAENERTAGSGLKKLCEAEHEYRERDLDGNGVNDFWTGDIAALAKHGLISRELAEADAEPLVPLVPKPVPYKGYLFRVLISDDSDPSAGPYRQDTDRMSGKVHHLRKFAFVGFPAEPGVTGRYIFIVNENNIAPRHDAAYPVPRNWPSNDEFKQWAKAF